MIRYLEGYLWLSKMQEVVDKITDNAVEVYLDNFVVGSVSAFIDNNGTIRCSKV